MDYQIGEDLKEKVRHYPISSAVAQLTDEFRSFPVPSITSRARHWHTKMTLRMSLARNSMVWKMRKMRKVSTTMWVPLHICYPRQHTDLRDRIRNQTGVSQHDAALRPSAFRPHRQQDPMSTKSANSSDAGCLLRFLHRHLSDTSSKSMPPKEGLPPPTDILLPCVPLPKCYIQSRPTSIF